MNKKKMFAVINCLLILVFLTGCLRMRSNYIINRDGSGKLEIISAMTTDFYELAKLEEENPFAEIKKLADKEEYEIKEYQADKYSGFKLIMNFDNIVELEELADDDILFALSDEIEIDNVDAGPTISEKQRFFYTTYTYQDEIDLSDIDDELEDEEMAIGMQAFLQEGIDMGIKFKLPVEPLGHTATSVENDGKKLLWDFRIGEKQEIFFEMRVFNRKNIASISVIILIIFLIAYNLLKKANKKDYNRHLKPQSD